MCVTTIGLQLCIVEFGLLRLQLVAASHDCLVGHDVLVEDYDNVA